MKENQKINCTVKSCVHQDERTKRCTLPSIQVVPTDGCDVCDYDESMCGSYEYCK